MKNLKMKLYILILLLVSSSTLVAQLNTLRENELIFSSGVEFNDTIHENLGAKVPNDVCNQAVTSAKCDQAYGTYWQVFQEATIGTLNVTLVRAQGLEEDFKIIVSEIEGIEIGSSVTDSSGFNTAPFSSNAFKQSIDGTTPPTSEISQDRGSFTYLQAGTSVFGPSIWVRNDVDSNQAAINAYRAVDWALNPAGPESLGFNIFSLDDTASKEVLIGNYFEVNPEKTAVRIHQQGSTDCDSFSNGLCIEGDASVKSVIGKIGLIGSAVAQKTNVAWIKLTDTGADAVGHFNGMTQYGGGQSTDATFRELNPERVIFEFNDIELDTKGGLQASSPVDYMVAYIGFISITGLDSQDSLQYWMQVRPADNTGASDVRCNSRYVAQSLDGGLGGGHNVNYTTVALDSPHSNNVDSVAGNYNQVLYSTKGEFDYQAGANSEASFQFVVIENIKGYYDKPIKRDISLCWDWSFTANSAGDNHMPTNEAVNVSGGYLIYGLPTGQTY